jgi:hypothetical protein
MQKFEDHCCKTITVMLPFHGFVIRNDTHPVENTKPSTLPGSGDAVKMLCKV